MLLRRGASLIAGKNAIHPTFTNCQHPSTDQLLPREVIAMPTQPGDSACFRASRSADCNSRRFMPRPVLPYAVRVGKHIRSLPKEQDEFIAVVYEYVEGGENDAETVEKVASFLWLPGFSFCATPLARNRRSGVLVDHSDIVGPLFYG